MTTADFLAGCFWPLAITFALSIWKLRNSNAWWLVLAWAVGAALFYFIFFFVYGPLSIVVLVDWMIGMTLFGLLTLLFGVSLSMFAEERKEIWRGIAVALFGLSTTVLVAAIIVQDFALPREIIEGRVESHYSRGRMMNYYVTISGRTVRAIIPDYERLKLKPVVRAEVGRGSDYIYRIEYLAN